MDIQRLGFIDSLLKIIDYEDESTPDHVIAKYILENYFRIASLNIYDVAAECYVSRSSVRRFCVNIGYDNFLELKKEFKAFDYQYNYFMEMHEDDNFRQWYGEEVVKMKDDVDSMITQEMLEAMAQRIHDGERVIFLSSYSSMQCVTEFQRPLVLLHKIIKVMTERNFNGAELAALKETDAVFMVSVMGNFASSNLDVLTDCHAYKALITTSRNPDFKGRFSDIYYLTREDYSNVKSARGKYGIFYLMDVLFDVYLKKYGKK